MSSVSQFASMAILQQRLTCRAACVTHACTRQQPALLGCAVHSRPRGQQTYSASKVLRRPPPSATQQCRPALPSIFWQCFKQDFPGRPDIGQLPCLIVVGDVQSRPHGQSGLLPPPPPQQQQQLPCSQADPTAAAPRAPAMCARWPTSAGRAMTAMTGRTSITPAARRVARRDSWISIRHYYCLCSPHGHHSL